jgi:hypothetical protein
MTATGAEQLRDVAFSALLRLPQWDMDEFDEPRF